MTTSTVALLASRKTKANPMNRRSVDRSVVMRDKQLAARPPVVERDRQPLHVRVEVAAQVGLDGERRDGHGPAAQEEQDGLSHTEHEGDRGQPPQPGRVVVADRPVDDRHDHQRHQRLRQHGPERGEDHEPHRPAVRTNPRTQSQQRSHPRRLVETLDGGVGARRIGGGGHDWFSALVSSRDGGTAQAVTEVSGAGVWAGRRRLSVGAVTCSQRSRQNQCRRTVFVTACCLNPA